MKQYNLVEINRLLKKYKDAKRDENIVSAIKAVSGEETKDTAFDIFTDEERAALEQAAQKKLAKAIITMMVHEQDFYANILLKLKKVPTWGLDNIRHRFKNLDILLEFDPFFVLDNTTNTLTYHLVHEALHIVLRHEQRINKLKHKLVDLGTQQTKDQNEIEMMEAKEVHDSKDIAADFAVNNVMPYNIKNKVPRQSIVEAPEYGVYTDGDPTAELYNDEVLNKFMHIKPNQDDGSGNNGAGGMNGASGGSGNGPSKRINQHVAPEYEDTLQEVLSNGQLDNMIRDAADSCKGIGNLPGCVQDEIERLRKPPQIDWRAALRNYVSAKLPAQSTRTWARLNRRFPYIIKGNKKRRVPLITVAIDTSGSVDDKQLETFLPEIDAIRKIHKADVEFIQCDMKIQDIKLVKAKDKFPAVFKGRGGTSMLPVWEYLDKEAKRKPDVVIYLSDLEVNADDFLDRPRNYSVVYVGTNEDMVREWSNRIKIGKFIYLKVKEEVL